jgi:DNA invertase Pin-like site-specific DNA recombinase
MTAWPYAYCRKSRIFRDKAIVSPEMQLAQVTKLAESYGDSIHVALDDMNVSGRKGRGQRPGFDALLSAVEAGQVSAIYSYSLSRLSRSTNDILALAELCAAHGVPIRLARDPDPDPTSPSGKLILTMLGALAQFESDIASERSRDIIETRRARGDKLGPPFYGDAEVVVGAFTRAGSYSGAAKLLTTEKVPTVNGKPWRPTTVRQIVLRERPDLAPRGSHRGSKQSAPFILYRLLRCHCGATMTGTRRPGSRLADYRCTAGRAQTIEFHSRPTSIAESAILQWVKDEAGHLTTPATLDMPASDEDREALAEERRRTTLAWTRRGLSDADYEARMAEIDETMAALDERVESVPELDWSLEPEEINADLRGIFRWVQLGADLRPTEAVWRSPSLRAQ